MSTFLSLYTLPTILFIIGIATYFKVAEHWNIIDKPNIRSSHSSPTIRGGGVIFVFAVIYFAINNSFDQPYFLVGFLVISLISFLDDIREMPKRWRLGIHLLSSLLVIFEITNGELYWWQWGVFLVVAISVINFYNFMDGINGITAFYSLVILGSLLYLQQQGYLVTSEELIILPIIALVIFSIFNVRKRAWCFAGDVGSISIAFLVVYLLGLLCWQQQDSVYIWLLGVYGVDAVFTIVQRLFMGQNILQGHRLHLYQLMANEQGISHVKVSMLYAFIQLLLNVFILKYIVPNEIDSYVVHIGLSVVSLSIYVPIKLWVMKGVQQGRLLHTKG